MLKVYIVLAIVFTICCGTEIEKKRRHKRSRGAETQVVCVVLEANEEKPLLNELDEDMYDDDDKKKKLTAKKTSASHVQKPKKTHLTKRSFLVFIQPNKMVLI